jgi:predicted HTH domain antitoxin
MSVLSVRIDQEIEKKISFLLEKGYIEDKSAFIRRLLDKSLTEEIINVLCIQIEKGEITIWKSAEIACLSLEQMLSEVAKRNIDLFVLKSLSEDLETLREM